MKSSFRRMQSARSAAGLIIGVSLIFSACTKSDPEAADGSNVEAVIEDAVKEAGSQDVSTVVDSIGDPVAPSTGAVTNTDGAVSTDGGLVTAATNEVVDQLVLTVGGGFTTWQTNVGTLPIAFISEGTLLRGVPAAQMDPARSIDLLAPKATTQTIKPPALEEIAMWLYRAGFKGDPLDFGDPGVTDMPTTSVAFTISGTFYRQSAYALDFPNPPTGLSDEQLKNRANFSTLVEFLSDPETAYGATNFGPAAPYLPKAYSLWGARYGVPVPYEGKGPKLVKAPWPHSSISLSSFLEQPSCEPVEEADTAAVAASFADLSSRAPKAASSPITTLAFEDSGAVSELVLVPVFPGMAVCATDDPYRLAADPS